MGVWDTTTPAGSDNISAGDDRIREMKVAIQEALQCTDATLGNAGSFPGSSPATAPEFAYRGHRGTTAQRTALSADVSGICFDTDDSQLYSYAGGSWNVVGTLGEAVIPAGTKALFYQAAAPTGWTRDTTSALNDKFISIVTAGSPGTTTGTHAASTNIGNHTHGAGTLQWQVLEKYDSGGSKYLRGFTSGGANRQLTSYGTEGSGTDPSLILRTADDGVVYTKSGTGASAVTSLGSGSYGRVQCMIATKDAY